MGKIIRRLNHEIYKFSMMYKELEVSAHAAAASFYLFLSIIPMIALVLTIVPYFPVSQEQLTKFLSIVLPGTLDSFIDSVTLQMYGNGQNPIYLIASAVLLVWSAGKGMQSITRGLNAVYGVKNEKRPFLLLRFEACVYTILLVVFLMVSVLVTFVAKYLLTRIMAYFRVDLNFYVTLLDNRYLVEWAAFALLFATMYGLVPYKKRWPHTMWRGALFAGVGCTLFSMGFNYYLNHFNAFSMYGSMATIMITMIWIFIFMTIFFAGALLNMFAFQVKEKRINRKVKNQNIKETEVLIPDVDRKDAMEKIKIKKRKLEELSSDEDVNVYEENAL